MMDSQWQTFHFNKSIADPKHLDPCPRCFAKLLSKGMKERDKDCLKKSRFFKSRLSLHFRGRLDLELDFGSGATKSSVPSLQNSRISL